MKMETLLKGSALVFKCGLAVVSGVEEIKKTTEFFKNSKSKK